MGRAMILVTALALAACGEEQTMMRGGSGGGSVADGGGTGGAGGGSGGASTATSTYCCVSANSSVVCSGNPAPTVDAGGLPACPPATMPGDPCDDAGGVYDKGGRCCHLCLDVTLACVPCPP